MTQLRHLATRFAVTHNPVFRRRRGKVRSSPDGSKHEASRVHHAHWRRGDCVATNGTGAAAGFLTSLGRNDRPNLAVAFRRGLGEAGYVESRNVAVEYRFAENQQDRLPALAADLIARKVAVITATGGGNSILAAQAATTTIPIVFTFGGDPVRAGFVASLNRPGGNVTGVSFFGTMLSAKGLGLLQELVPNAALVALLVNPQLPESARTISDTQEAARTLGRQLLVLLPRASAEPRSAVLSLCIPGRRAQHCGKQRPQPLA
jgi:ABC transporter substrate binding protein